MASTILKLSALLIVFSLFSVTEGAKKGDSPKQQDQPGEKLQRRNWYDVKEEKKESKGYEKKKEDDYKETDNDKYDSSPDEYGPKPSYKASSEENYGKESSDVYGGGYGENSYERSREGGYEKDSYNKKSAGYGSTEYKPKKEYGGYGEEEGRKGYGKPQQKYGGGYRERPRQDYGEKKRTYSGDYGMKGGKNYKQQSEYSPFSSGYAHSHDTHYCSIHGSFSLALPTYTQGYDQSYKKEGGEYGGQQSYGDDSGYGGDKEEGYGGKSDGGYGSSGDKKYRRKSVVRHHTRQFCRYAAAYSYKACKFCCRVVARSANTSPDEIVAAIFAFNPSSPSSNGAGIGYDDSDSYGQQKKGGYNNDNRKNQCVCCAPKFKY